MISYIKKNEIQYMTCIDVQVQNYSTLYTASKTHTVKHTHWHLWTPKSKNIHQYKTVRSVAHPGGILHKVLEYHISAQTVTNIHISLQITGSHAQPRVCFSLMMWSTCFILMIAAWQCVTHHPFIAHSCFWKETVWTCEAPWTSIKYYLHVSSMKLRS